MADFKTPPSTLDCDAFAAMYGGVYEHSPHFARSIWHQAPGGGLDTLEGLATALRAAVETSGREARLALIRAHPDLANRLRTAPLTRASSLEQASAGLDHCNPEELAEFQRLNAAYTAKFGFPFIKAVRGFTRAQILEEFRKRAANDSDSEFAAALSEIHKIARQRLTDMT